MYFSKSLIKHVGENWLLQNPKTLHSISFVSLLLKTLEFGKASLYKLQYICIVVS